MSSTIVDDIICGTTVLRTLVLFLIQLKSRWPWALTSLSLAMVFMLLLKLRSTRFPYYETSFCCGAVKDGYFGPRIGTSSSWGFFCILRMLSFFVLHV